MHKKSPFDVVLSRHVTEKASVLQQLQFNTSNACVKKCDAPKYVFVVDKRANKQEIAAALEEIYAERKIKVVSVNTLNTKPKARRVRGRPGVKAGFKKAIVTLASGDSIEDKV
jgi:large subunit ribosomal protein L23